MYFKKLEERLGYRFNLSKVKFNFCTDKITLVCKKCGSERIVILSNALKHNVCCSNIRCKNEAKRLKFEEQGRAKWGDQFDYSKAHTLGDRNVKLEIKCNKCGDTKYNVNGTVYKYSIDALKALNYTGDNPAKFLKQYKVKYKLPKLYAPLSSNRYSKAG